MKRILLILLLLLVVGVIPTAAQRDSDGDGVADGNDQCPHVVGSPANNGCPGGQFAPNPQQSPADTDGDGIPDSDDQCPTVVGVRENGGCPVSSPPNNPPNNPPPSNPPAGQPPANNGSGDSDGDGTPDGSDACPTQGGPAHLNGCPDTTQDSDGDTIPDPVDQCPNVGGAVDSSGCPPFAPPTLPTDGCYVTPSGDFRTNVRAAPFENAPIIGHLLPSVVYQALGYIVNGADIWVMLAHYEGSGTEIGYVASRVLNTASCAETSAGQGVNNLRQLGLAVHNYSNTTDLPPATRESFGRYLDLACAGGYLVFWTVDRTGAEMPNRFGGGCTDDHTKTFPPAPLQVDPTLFEALIAQIGTCAAGMNHGVSVLAWARVDGVSPAQDDVVVDGRIITGENFESAFSCGTTLDDFLAGADTTHGEHDKWIIIEYTSGGAATAGGAGKVSMHDFTFTLKMASVLCSSDALLWWDVDADGDVLDGTINSLCLAELPIMPQPAGLAEGLVIGTVEEPDPFVLTIAPTATNSDVVPVSQVSFNFTEIKFHYDSAALNLDLRDTEIGGTRGNDDGSTTVEYCFYVELYEVGVFNQVCYTVEVPPNCELVSSEAGVYTVVCDGEGQVSLNPVWDGLPALDVTVPSRDDATFAAYMKLADIKGRID